MRKIWPFTFYFLLFAAVASVSPFLVLYYQQLGFTGAQIGLLTGITPLVTFFSAPLWTGLADATGQHRLIMCIAILGAMVVASIFPLLGAFLPVLMIAILLNAFLAPISPFADSAAMFILAAKKELYGRVRLGGTIGFGLAAYVSGIFVQNHGLKFAFWGCAALLFVAFFVSQKLAHDPSQANTSATSRARKLLADPRWLLFLAVAFAGGLALSAQNTYFFPYMKELGAKESTMGLALTIGTISEVPVLFFANRLIKRLSPYRMLILSMLITGLRLLLYVACQTPGPVLFVQLLNGLTLPAMLVAGVSYAAENAPAGMSATAQGLFSATFFGFGNAVGSFTGGLLLESIGGGGLYLVFGVIVLTIVAIVVLIQRRLPGTL